MSSKVWPTAIKRMHVGLLHFVWTTLVPRTYGIPEDDAQEAWAMFAKNPKDPKLVNAKRMANELWLLYVQAN